MNKVDYKKIVILSILLMIIISYVLGGIEYINTLCSISKMAKVIMAIIVITLSAFISVLVVKYVNFRNNYNFKTAKRDFFERYFSGKNELIMLLAIVIVGLCIRVVGYNWGKVTISQPDESNFVNPAIYMARDWNFYQTYTCFYPAQWTPKLVAVIIKIYGELIGTDYNLTTFIEAYFIYRIFGAVLSTFTIIVAFLIGNYIKKHLGIIVAMLVAVYPSFVVMAYQVTADVIVLFNLSLVMLFALRYMENRKFRFMNLMCLFTAMATLDKWRGAVGIGFVGVMLLFNSDGIVDYIKRGLGALLTYFCWLTVLAPNVVFNIKESIIDGFINIAVYDGGNPEPYYSMIVGYAGYGFINIGGIIAIALLVCGLVVLLGNFRKQYLIFLMGPLKTMCLCFMNRRFLRWGLELYLCELFVLGIGILALYENAMIVIKTTAVVAALIVSLEFATGSLLDMAVATHSQNDTILLQREACRENGIDETNSLGDRCTAFDPVGMCDVEIGDNSSLWCRDQCPWDEQFIEVNGVACKRLAWSYALFSGKNEWIEKLEKNGAVVTEYKPICGGIFADPVQSKDTGINDYKIIRENIKLISEVFSGGMTGYEIYTVDIRNVPIADM